MLRKFKVSNFKGFENDFVFDLTQVNGYEFNIECIKNNTINNALVYGHNGVGKSNLALAVFDITEHLTDAMNIDKVYINYLNALNPLNYATFYFEFLLNGKTLVYEYRKTDYRTLIYEKFSIDGEVLAYIDRNESNSASIKFKGAENLKTEITNKELSVLKYVKNNTVLEENSINETFYAFFTFVEKMLFFRTLEDRFFLGLKEKRTQILENIIENDHVKDFENFLNEANVECRLEIIEEIDKKTIAFNFNGKKIAFDQAASTGTSALTLFYFWYQSMKQSSNVSFVFIDEFDAFYHHELSALIIRKLKETGIQCVLTTHNVSLISNELLRPDCYFLMNKKAIGSLSKCTEKELREAHNIEKMYKAGAFHVE